MAFFMGTCSEFLSDVTLPGGQSKLLLAVLLWALRGRSFDLF